ncbi:MAG: APC family permease, partial [Candidatus Caldarchaeum sp.]
MVTVKKADRLHKSLTLPYVYVLAVATISSGFFLLPGIAAQEAGPAVFLCYAIAALPVIPEVYSISELGTAMPRSGGTYYFIDRSVGPLIGTIAGLGFWFAFILKSAFALIGMGAYVSLIYPDFNIVPLAIGFALFFGAVNILGAKESAWVQVYLISGLLAILAAFITQGLIEINPAHFEGLFDGGAGSLLSTAGMVYISYIGVTKVASAAEEIHNPERNLPRGIILAVATCAGVYVLGTFVIVGLAPKEELYGNLTPAALAAGKMWGKWGIHLVIVGAILAFVSVANAGILSASRY